MVITKSLLYVLLYFYAFWLFFLAIMSLYRAHREKTLSRTALIIGYPILIIGATMDFIFNILFATIIFLDLPHEYMFTKRLVKYKKYGTGWRQSLANFICTKLLDPFDIGQGHCR